MIYSGLMGFYSVFMGFIVIYWDFIVIQWDINGIYPLVNVNSLRTGKLPIEFVDLPIHRKWWIFPSFSVNVYQAGYIPLRSH